MREVFTKNAFTRGYTGSRGTKVTPGWREGTYDVEYNNSADAGGGTGSLTVAAGIIGATSIGLVIMSIAYLQLVHYLLLGGIVALTVAIMVNKKLSRSFKTDCVLLTLLAILVLLINNYAAGLLLDQSLSAQSRASNAVFLLFFGGAFLTLVSTLLVADVSEILGVCWFLSLAWAVLASCGYFIGLGDWNLGWLSFIVIGIYGIKLFREYNTAMRKIRNR